MASPIFNAVEISSSLLHIQGTRQAAYLSHCVYKARKAQEEEELAPLSFSGRLSGDMTLEQARAAAPEDVLLDLARIAVAAMHHENDVGRITVIRQKQSSTTFQFSPSVPWDVLFSAYYDTLSPHPVPHLLDPVSPRILLAAVRLPDPLA